MVMKRSLGLSGPNDPRFKVALYYAKKRRKERLLRGLIPVPPVVDPHRYWRLFMSDSAGAAEIYTGLTDIQLRDVAGGPDLTSPAQSAARAFANTTFSVDHGPGNAFNDTIATGAGNIWSTSANTHSPAFIGWDFVDTPKDIREAVITGLNVTAQSPYDAQMEYSDDNVNWFPAWDLGILGLGALQSKTFTAPDKGAETIFDYLKTNEADYLASTSAFSAKGDILIFNKPHVLTHVRFQTTLSMSGNIIIGAMNGVDTISRILRRTAFPSTVTSGWTEVKLSSPVEVNGRIGIILDGNIGFNTSNGLRYDPTSTQPTNGGGISWSGTSFRSTDSVIDRNSANGTPGDTTWAIDFKGHSRPT